MLQFALHTREARGLIKVLIYGPPVFWLAAKPPNSIGHLQLLGSGQKWRRPTAPATSPGSLGRPGGPSSRGKSPPQTSRTSQNALAAGISICIYIYVHTHTHTCVCTHTYMYRYMCLHMYIYVCVDIYTCVHTYVFVCSCVYMYTYTYVHACAHA